MALRARFPVTEIVLFGSKARGDSEPESDIDLLVLTSRPLDSEEQRRIWRDLHDISMRFEVMLSPLTVEVQSWREGVHSIGSEVEREGARCRFGDGQPTADRMPARVSPPPALVKQVVAEWMGMAEEALASVRAEVDAQRWRSASNRAYYAAFYAASAVLLSRGRHFVRHAGVQTALHRDVVHTRLLAPEHGEPCDELFKLRLIADCTVTGIDADPATRSLSQASAIVAEMRRMLAAEGMRIVGRIRA